MRAELVRRSTRHARARSASRHGRAASGRRRHTWSACARWDTPSETTWRLRSLTRRPVDRSKHPVVVTKTALDKAREAPGSTKARILAAAEEVFAARGFNGASTREIAARAGREHLEPALPLGVEGDALRRGLPQRLRPDRRAAPRARSRRCWREQPRPPRDHRPDHATGSSTSSPTTRTCRSCCCAASSRTTDIDVGVERDVLVPAWERVLGLAEPPRPEDRPTPTPASSCCRCTPCCWSTCSTAGPIRALLGGSVRTDALARAGARST